MLTARRRDSEGAAVAVVDIDVFSDYICPFCYIGNGLLKRVARGSAHVLRVRWLGLEIHPDTPPEGRDLKDLFQGDGYVGVHKALGERARDLGLPFHPPATLPNAHRAHLLAEFARDHGAFEAVHDGLFHAYFGEGKDLNRTDTLAAVAAGAGLDPEEALREGRAAYEDRIKSVADVAGRYGIDGTPTFVLQRRWAVVGAQPYEVLKEAVERAAAGDM